MKSIVAIATIAALTAACSAEDTTVAAPPTETATAQESPTEEPVEVITVQPAATEAVTPQACLDAIKYAREGFQVASAFASTTVDLLSLMQDALTEALSMGDVSQSSVARMQRISQQTSQHDADIQRVAPKFISAANECEAGA